MSATISRPLLPKRSRPKKKAPRKAATRVARRGRHKPAGSSATARRAAPPVAQPGASQVEDAAPPSHEPPAHHLAPAVLSADAEMLPEAEQASPADHAAVHQFLTAVFQGPSRDAWHTLLEDPFYEPTDRVLVKVGEQLLGHAQVSKRTMHFGAVSLPVASLYWLGTRPEFRRRGVARRLLAAADRVMVADSTQVGFLTTRLPAVFERHGWVACGRVACSQASTRDLKAQLTELGHGTEAWRLNIRPWRHVEMPALMRIYAQNAATAFGAVERSEQTWRWLINRKHFDQIHVAIDGPDRLELEEGDSPIVGYFIMRQDKIIELMAAPHHPTAALELLARACGEAIERDYHAVTLQSPADSPLHALFQAARGANAPEPQPAECLMARIFSPVEFVSRLAPVLSERAARAGLPRQCELGLNVDGEKMQIVVSRRVARVHAGKLGRSYLTCSRAQFTRLALGRLDVREAVFNDRVEASTRVAIDAAAGLFPRLALWRLPLDDLTN